MTWGFIALSEVGTAVKKTQSVAVEIPRSRPSASSLTLGKTPVSPRLFAGGFNLCPSFPLPPPPQQFSFWLIVFIIHVEWSDVASLNAHEYLRDETLTGRWRFQPGWMAENEAQCLHGRRTNLHPLCPLRLGEIAFKMPLRCHGTHYDQSCLMQRRGNASALCCIVSECL